MVRCFINNRLVETTSKSPAIDKSVVAYYVSFSVLAHTHNAHNRKARFKVIRTAWKIIYLRTKITAFF